jgi:hypothetical protein
VPQDVTGLISLIGGDAKFTAKLDELFTTNPTLTGRFQSDITGLIGQYAHGNEPSHHMAYLYTYAGTPWKTQEKVHTIVSTLYSSSPDGLCGNEDCGQMSAWYVFSALGFYPVCPGDNTYVIGTPLFDTATIATSGGSRFTVIARNVSEKNFYIQSASLNGKDYRSTFITHADIMNGGSLVLVMGPAPSTWGTTPSSRPRTSIDIPFVQVPFLASGERVFRDSTVAALGSIDTSALIYYTTDTTDPLKARQQYSHPIVFSASGLLTAVCVKNGVSSKPVTAIFTMIPAGRRIALRTEYHHSYTGGGPEGLIDGITGTENFATGAWQGYQGNDLDAVVDLGRVQKVSSIGASFFQNTGSWIFFPSQIVYAVSTDGITYTTVYEGHNTLDEHHNFTGARSFDVRVTDVEARYVKVYARNVGICPSWHSAAGSKAFLFVDEITVK